MKRFLPLLLCLGTAAHAAVLPVTAADEVMHAGDTTPPLTFRVTGGYKASGCTGLPAITTTATSGSAAGTYGITIAQGTLSCGSNTFTFTAGTLTVLPALDGSDGQRIGAKFTPNPTYPSDFMQTASQWATTVGCTLTTSDTDATANTACLNSILHYNRSQGGDYYENHRGILLTAMYPINGALSTYGNATTIRCSGSAGIKVVANSSAFGTGTDTAVLTYDQYGGNSTFRQFMYGCLIDVAPGNPNAIAVKYAGNNSASMVNNRFVSEDGEGKRGISQSGSALGPAYFENNESIGFQKGFEYGSGGYSVSMEANTAMACTDSGVTADANALATRHLLTWCAGSAPATNFGSSNYAIINSYLKGGSGGASSYGNTTSSGGTMRWRDTVAPGYGTCLIDNSTSLTTCPTDRYSGTAATLFSSAKSPTALKLTVPVIPTVTDPASTSWAPLGQDLTTWPTTFNSGASTVYAPFGNYPMGAGTTSQVVFNSSLTNCALNHIYLNDTAAGQPGWGGQTVTQLTFAFASNCSGVPLIIDGLGVYAKLINNSPRKLVIRDGIPTSYTQNTSAGDIFKLNVQFLQGTFSVGHGQHIWSWQDDTEPVSLAHVIADGIGTTYWSLLTKTEQPCTGTNCEVLTVQNSAKMEIIGSFLFGVNSFPAGASWVGVHNAQFAGSLFQYVEGSQNGVPDHYATAYNGASSLSYSPCSGSVACNPGFYYEDTTPAATVTVVLRNLRFNGKVN